MRTLLVSCYELGHQPLHVASPAAALRRAGHQVRALDLSVQPFDPEAFSWAEAVGFSVPMHTAMRLAMVAARRVRALRPDLPLCFYGLYAPVSRDLTVGRMVDRAIAGEYEPALVRWVDELEAASPSREGPVLIELGRSEFRLPARDLLPPLDRYAHLEAGEEHRLVGYVEASHGCRHRCRHCPIPAVYQGRIRAVDQELMLEDVARLVEMGARHITFGDPDFLNAVHHSLRVVREIHGAFPELTFDCTTKVEHVLRHREVWGELAAAGCVFVVSAFETVNDEILHLMDKGHTAAQASGAIEVLRSHGVEVRPSWLPFTPWTRIEDLVDILDFIAAHDLYGSTDPVQLTIRLLLPEGSLLLDVPEILPYLDDYDREALSYRWRAADPEVDRLQSRLATVAAEGAGRAVEQEELLERVWKEIMEAAGKGGGGQIPVGATAGRPRLTEPWFC
ncbi:MAG: CUAEP/CCAEP-tail radical SAM protein [Actinomycetota bacterium]|nr:CUAEP/CCAEP-tail radical SAM protein [Actinomycetota bacterium]